MGPECDILKDSAGRRQERLKLEALAADPVGRS
jgi:hypothetical protein